MRIANSSVRRRLAVSGFITNPNNVCIPWLLGFTKKRSPQPTGYGLTPTYGLSIKVKNKIDVGIYPSSRIDKINVLEIDFHFTLVAIIVIENDSTNPPPAFESYSPLITPVDGLIESPEGSQLAE